MPSLLPRFQTALVIVSLFHTLSVYADDKPIGARQFVRQIIAHRGLSADRPENTVASVKRAIEVGATAVEVDVRLTKDDQLILLHDAKLDRTTNGKGPVRQMMFDDVRRLDAGKWFDKQYAGEKVPTLAEVLTACRGKIDVLLDLKEDGEAFAKAVVAEVKVSGQPERTIVGVRSVEQAKQFRRLLPSARQIGLIAHPDDMDGYVAVGVPMIRLWSRWLSDESLVDRVRLSGAKLHFNTEVGKPEEVLPLLKFRPDSMSSDDPAQLIASLIAAPPESYQLPQAQPKTPVIIDTDIGSSVDDAFALGLAFASSELDVRAITTVGSQPDDRAWMVCRFLAQIGRRTIPVGIGNSPPKSSPIDWQIQYRRHAAVIFNRMGKPSPLSAVDLMYNTLKESPGKVTIIALGPLTNVAKLIESHPDCLPWVKQIVVMGGAIHLGYDGAKKPEPEWNFVADVPAARKVLQADVPVTLVPLDVTAHVKIDAPSLEKIFARCTPLTFQVQSLYELAKEESPVLYDPVAVAAAMGDDFFKFQDLRLAIDDTGLTRVVKDDQVLKTLRTAMSIDRARFLNFYVDRLINTGKPVLPRAPGNLSKVVEQGGYPAKVHVAENFDTDIEKRWWMVGKEENSDVPPQGRRACRAVLTLDFDDLQGEPRAMYRAVVFNPVPGPPMGPRTRLSFMYKLTGTDVLRVQLYSLTKGYHRYLSLKGLPQGTWQSATVDMTHMRRPDGSGGPLDENERIDDIQFYIDPRAELVIDDIVLYDAPPVSEGRQNSPWDIQFPERIHFTGWFDTGSQGKEWPGNFQIVPHEAPHQWKFARSVDEPVSQTTWIRVSLRGMRRLDNNTWLDLRYRCSNRLGGENAGRENPAGTGAVVAGRGVTVELRNSKTGWSVAKSLGETHQILWKRTLREFETTPSRSGEAREIDEIHFLLPDGMQLDIDDLLLFSPKLPTK